MTKLLSREHLENSAVVANNRMNRERGADGVNSYERDVFLSPLEFLSKNSSEKTLTSWLDVCCGRGRALIQTAQELERKFPRRKFHLQGLDLVDAFDPVPGDCEVSLAATSFFEFDTEMKFDLLTCVHGLHYLGDKLEAIRKMCALLKPGGTLVANFDVKSIRNAADKNFHRRIAAWLRSNKVSCDARKRLLCAGGNKMLEVPFRYLGADDQAGPNYTGQEAVDSYYAM